MLQKSQKKFTWTILLKETFRLGLLTNFSVRLILRSFCCLTFFSFSSLAASCASNLSRRKQLIHTNDIIVVPHVRSKLILVPHVRSKLYSLLKQPTLTAERLQLILVLLALPPTWVGARVMFSFKLSSYLHSVLTEAHRKLLFFPKIYRVTAKFSLSWILLLNTNLMIKWTKKSCAARGKSLLRIVGYHFSSRLTDTLNLCSIYLKLLVHVASAHIILK